MPSTLTYPGVYVEEVPSGVRTIIGVPTSICALVGRAARGPVDDPITINGFGDFERTFGGLWTESRLGFAVRDFFRNGGGQAIIVRVFNDKGQLTEGDDAPVIAAIGSLKSAVASAADPAAAKTAAEAIVTPAQATQSGKDRVEAAKKSVVDAADAPNSTIEAVRALAQAIETPTFANGSIKIGSLAFSARDPGAWSASLRGRISRQVQPGTGARIHAPGNDDAKVFNVMITDASSGRSETIRNVTFEDSDRKLAQVLAQTSRLVDLDDSSVAPAAGPDPWTRKAGEKSLLEKEIETLEGLFKTATTVADLKLDDTRTLLASYLDSVTTEEELLRTLGLAWDAFKKSETQASIDAARPRFTEAQLTLKQAVDGARLALAQAVGDGQALDSDSFVGPNFEADKRGIYALRDADVFNLLVIPPYKGLDAAMTVDASVIGDAAALCEHERAFLIIDPPDGWIDKDAAKAGLEAEPSEIGTRSKNSAIFFPRILQPNPLHENRLETFTPSGVVAGVFARTDTERGVWKAPAGLDASLGGVPQLAIRLTAEENGELNPLGINCLRSLPTGLRVVWGARTLQGDDRLASEWKYVPIRRLALYIEESLFRGTQWVVFEPNDEPLWASIRLNVGAFMNGLFRQGAFQGKTPLEAYFVRCDKDTNPQEDADRGIVNILVGFAPLKPAEFVVIKLQQIAGQLQA